MMRILIVDDHPLIRTGLRELLETEWREKLVVGEAESGPQAIEKLAQCSWDLVLVDINLPGRSGVVVLEDIKAMSPNLPVLILSAYEESDYLVRIIKAGAAGFVAKQATHLDLVKAVKTVLAGGKYISDKGALLLLNEIQDGGQKPIHTILSQREFQVLCMLGAGNTPGEIASALSLSLKTISTYRARILEKLNLTSTAQLIRYAIEHRLTES